MLVLMKHTRLLSNKCHFRCVCVLSDMTKAMQTHNTFVKPLQKLRFHKQ